MKLFSFLLSTLSCITLVFADSVSDELKAKIRENNPPSWMIEQIQGDLQKISPRSLTNDALEEAMQETATDLMLIRYQIRDGKLQIHSTTPWAKENFRQYQLTEALNELTSICQGKYRLPNCDFIVCIQDYFEGKKHPASFFVFSKQISERREILFPNTEILAKGEQLKKEALEGNDKYPWDEKSDIAFWRGATTGFLGTFTLENYLNYPRFQLVKMSTENPEWVDARFHWLCQGTEKFLENNPDFVGQTFGIPEHMQYKYQILVDGNGCTWARAYWQLFCNSLIIKHDSDWIEYYYPALLPYVHYIPVANDFHNLKEAISWAREHDSLSKEISANAQNFAHQNLKRSDIFYYIYLLLNQYAMLQAQ